ncbi:hypothetical protein GWK47_036279 [Chionoecetes opilio]|uniref:Uncharacterized protein n=1 Tax=Chionoecetes opilio TaxID=41210 RepID=A0A8J4YFY9_CHIOP|nr:hypothetical protein GWK47_036279 [Chionoecetes opilio]
MAPINRVVTTLNIKSKFYSTQYIERPGMAKLLMVESNRHWEDGMNVLKKYLNLGGTTYGDIFMNSMTFKGENNMYGATSSIAKYKSSLKTVMQKSRRLGNTISDLYHSANHKPSSHGDADWFKLCFLDQDVMVITVQGEASGVSNEDNSPAGFPPCQHDAPWLAISYFLEGGGGVLSRPPEKELPGGGDIHLEGEPDLAL